MAIQEKLTDMNRSQLDEADAYLLSLMKTWASQRKENGKTKSSWRSRCRRRSPRRAAPPRACCGAAWFQRRCTGRRRLRAACLARSGPESAVVRCRSSPASRRTPRMSAVGLTAAQSRWSTRSTFDGFIGERSNGFGERSSTCRRDRWQESEICVCLCEMASNTCKLEGLDFDPVESRLPGPLMGQLAWNYVRQSNEHS